MLLDIFLPDAEFVAQGLESLFGLNFIIVHQTAANLGDRQLLHALLRRHAKCHGYQSDDYQL